MFLLLLVLALNPNHPVKQHLGLGITTKEVLPGGVPTGQCGPRLAAFTGLPMGHVRQSKRQTSMFLSDLLNTPSSQAWTVKIESLDSDSNNTNSLSTIRHQRKIGQGFAIGGQLAGVTASQLLGTPQPELLHTRP